MKSLTTIILLSVISLATAAIATAQVVVPSPGIVYSDLLQTIYLRDNGIFKPKSVYAYFLKPGKGRMKVLYEGTEIAEFSYRIDPYSGPKVELLSFDLVKGKNDTLGLKLTKPGKYDLHYSTGEKVFSKFSFSLTAPSDPYATSQKGTLNGPWNKFAYLRRTSKEAHGKWEFRIFLRSPSGTQQQAKAQVVVTRDSDKKVVAVGTNGFRLDLGWRRQDFVLKKPGKVNAKGIYYGNTDLLVTRDPLSDGMHTATLSIDGKQYGKYQFNIKDGMITPSGRQDRSTTEPADFIEGAGVEFWMEKQEK